MTRSFSRFGGFYVEYFARDRSGFNVIKPFYMRLWCTGK